MSQESFDQLLAFFKVMANENRLKIVGLLASGPLTVGELAEMLQLRESSVSENLAMLRAAGLVSMTPQGSRHVYALNTKALAALNRDVLSRKKLAALVKPEETPEDFAARTLRRFMSEGRLTQIPAARRKLLVVLDYLAGQFEFGRRYPEKEVNEILRRHHEDFALLRRELVDFHYLRREGIVYWRLRHDEAPPAT
jgi:predicted transcriptional regulator